MDDEGRLTIGDLPGGSLRFVATAAGGTSGETEIQVPTDGEATGIIRVR